MNHVGKKINVAIDNDEIDIRAIIGEVMANKWLIMLTTLIALSIGYIYAYREIPQYESDVLLQIDSAKPGFGQGGFVEQLALGGSSGANGASTEIALIQSRFILDPVIESLHLDIFVKRKYNSIWQRLFPKVKGKKETIQIQAFDVPQSQLNKIYTLYIDKPGHVSLINSEHKLILQGQEGKKLTNKQNTVHLRIQSINAPEGTTFTLIKRSKATVVNLLKSHLKIEEQGEKKFQAGTGILNVKLTGDNPRQVINILNNIAFTAKEKDANKKAQEASQTLSFLEQQLPITKGQLEQAEYNLNQYRAKSGKIDIKLQTQALLAQFSDLEKELGKLRIEKINMQQQYTSKHPILIAVNTQIKSLEAQRHELERSLKTLPASDQVAVNWFRDVKVKKTLYMILLNKIQELQVVKAGTISSLRILALAKMPDRPLPSRKPVTYAASILLGLMLSFMIIIIRRMLSSKIDDPHWSERQFNLPNLAIIPFCKEQKNLLLNSAEAIPLLAMSNPKNLSIESLRSLRTSFQVSLAGATNNIVSILGISPEVGKSFISANMAYLLASAGKKVLIIDADLRRGTMHKYMAIPSSPGVAEVLNGTATIDAAVSVTMNGNLCCLPRGSYPEDPSELLMSSQFKSLMQTLSAQYDVVIIDTAPVLLVTDAVIVGGLSGTNYLVLGAGVHEASEIEMAIKRLLGAGVHLHGSIFNYNRPQLKKMMGSKYYNYNYNYSYYYDESMKVKS